jgi:DNA repair protein RecO (recombination protein O)
VNEAVVKEGFEGLRADMEKLALGAYFSECMEALSVEDQPEPELLQLGLNCLYALSRGLYPPAHIKAAFELRLACLAGFAPELSACPVCGSGAPDRFDLSQGMVFCEGCREGETGIRLPVSPGMLLAMRYIVWCEPKKLFSFRLEGEGLRALSSLTEAYLMTQLEHSFYTLDFYKSLLHYGETI